MAVTKDDFEKIWASSSPLTPYSFSDSQYKEGWNFVGSTPPSRQMWDAFMKNADEKLQYLYHHEDVPLGHEYFTFNPSIPQGSLPLFGGEYARDTYSDLWAWVQTQTGYLKTEAEWQTLSASNNGNVPYYSDGDGSTTFRVPSLKCWIKGANGTVSEVGSYLAAGLPNITGSMTPSFLRSNGTPTISGAFIGSTASTASTWGANSNVSVNDIKIDASKSNPIYGNSTTVQPESIVGMWLVKAYGVIVDTGTIDEQQYIDDRIAAEVTRADGKYLPLNGGTMTGEIKGNPVTLTAESGGDSSSLVLGADKSMTWDGVSLTDGTLLTTRTVSTPTITSSTSDGIYITAPAVSGYQFVCWYMSTSEGGVYATYIGYSGHETGRVWWVGSTPTGTHIDLNALYVRKW